MGLTVSPSGGVSQAYVDAGDTAAFNNAAAYSDAALAAALAVLPTQRIINDSYSDQPSTSTNGTEDTLLSVDCVQNPIDGLFAAGAEWVQKEVIVTVGSATASRRIKKYFSDGNGDVLIWDSGALTLALGSQFFLHTILMLDGDGRGRCVVVATTTSASTVPYVTYTWVTAPAGLDSYGSLLTRAIASGTGAAAGDIVQKFSKVIRIPEFTG